MHYDLYGMPISMARWVQLVEGNGNRVALAYVGRIRLSTAWLGIDHAFDDGSPILFETMTFARRPRDRAHGTAWQIQERYETREQALAGHHRWLTRLQARGVHAVLAAR